MSELIEYEVVVQRDCVEETKVTVKAATREEAFEIARNMDLDEEDWSMTDFLGDNRFYVANESGDLEEE